MPKFTLLIYGPTEGGPSPEEMQGEMPKWFEYTQSLIDAGVHVAGEGLLGPDAAQTVRVRGGETQVTDGPFAETKEFLGGFYLIDVDDIQTALDWAAKIPNVSYGSTEVRPVMEFDMATAGDAQAQGQA